MKILKGKVAVVTGAASGIGRGLADRFAAEGMKVVLADIEEGPLQAAVDEITSTGAQAIGVRTDVRIEAEVQNLADRTTDAFGAVHVLCNNAGVETGAMFADIPDSVWRWVLGVDVFGVVHGCRIFLPLIRQQGEGHIVNVGSAMSFEAALPTFAPYIVSKFAVLGLTEALDLELRTDGGNIGVSLLAPGAVKSQMTEAARNRPGEVPRTASDPTHDNFLAMVKQHTEQFGLEPSAVAEMVVDAILTNRFFILTDPAPSIAAVQARLARMEGGTAPEAWSAT